MDSHRDTPELEQLLLRHAVEQFYAMEAELLDTRQFEAWLDLLDEDIHYWMPLTRNKAFGEWEGELTEAGKDLNWFDEGKFELEQRVKQIMTGLHWAEEPVSRTSHLISNLQVEEDGEGIAAGCRFLLYRSRNQTESDTFVGKRHDRLKRVPGGFKIAERRILLDQNVLLAKNLTVFF